MNHRECVDEDQGSFPWTGLVEIRTSDHGGILVPPDAVDQMIAAMKAMEENKEKRR